MTDDVKQSESYVNSIVKQEHEALGERSGSERLADTVASSAGSFAFIALHLAFVTCWVTLPWQTRLIPTRSRYSE